MSPVDGLKAALDSAVEDEDYERAAQIRDQIRDLEGAEKLHDDM